MKTYHRILPILGIILGLLGLLLVLSFSDNKACAFANGNLLSIKENTQHALDAESLKMTKYHAYKALRSMENTKANVKDCGCEPALNTLTKTENNLKSAVKATNQPDAKDFLKIAFHNALFTLETLQNFEKEYASNYGDDILVLNTKEVLNEQGGILMTHKEQLKETMNNSLAEFQSSLGNVVEHVECADAFSFINKILDKSDKHLESSSLTNAQRQYHTRVREIAYKALLQLEGCPNK